MIDETTPIIGEAPSLLGPALPRKIRNAFAEKVLALVSVMFVLSASACCVVTNLAGDRRHETFWRKAPVYLVSSFVATMIKFFLCLWCTGMRNTVWGSYSLMGVLTFAFSTLFSAVGIECQIAGSPEPIYSGMCAGCLILFCVTLLTMQTRYDVTGMEMRLIVIMLSLVISAAVQLFVLWFDYKVNALDNILALVIIMLVSSSMLYELQLICGGKDPFHDFTVDDYALAAMRVYSGIAILVLRIVNILSRARPRTQNYYMFLFPGFRNFHVIPKEWCCSCCQVK